MVDLASIREGNWLFYERENQYCTFLRVDEFIWVTDFKGPLRCLLEELSAVRIDFQHPTVYGFDLDWRRRTSSGASVYVPLYGHATRLIGPSGASLPASSVHQLQNAYNDLTGELLPVNLYGSPIY
jgi:hypothetical protein